MDEIAKLAETVKILAQTIEASVARLEQLFKLQNDQLALLQSAGAEMRTVTEELRTTDEAWKEAVSDLDQGIDDISKVTAALLMIKKDQTKQDQLAES